MGFARIRGTLRSRVGRRVRFSPPQDVRLAGGAALCGVIVDEAWADEAINRSPARPPRGADDWGDYSFCAQRILWADGRYSIRLGYFRRRAGENCWEYAAQMTVCADCREVGSLLAALVAKSGWFRDIAD
jgi:hypothetical protein